MHNIILTAVLLILGSASASAQFYTITKEKGIRPEKQQKVVPDTPVSYTHLTLPTKLEV